jgi:transposase-like protein
METLFSRQITEDVADLKSREKEPFTKGIADRLRCLRLLKEGRASGLAEVALILGYHLRTVQRWWQHYRDGGIAALLPAPPRRGASERITPEAWADLQAEMQAGRLGSLHEAQVYLRGHWGIAATGASRPLGHRLWDRRDFQAVSAPQDQVEDRPPAPSQGRQPCRAGGV